MTDEDQFLRQRHAAFRTPRPAIEEAVRRVIGHDTAHLDQIVRGYANEVYRVHTTRGDRFIVRVNQHGHYRAREEAWAMEHARAAGAPVPRVLGVERVGEGERSRDLMVVEHARGRQLSEIDDALSTDERQRVWRGVGAAMRAYHSVAVGGFYLMHPDGSWDFPDWPSVVRSAIEGRAADAPYLLQAGLAEHEVAQLLAIVGELATLPAPQPVLCHGDLATEHLFVDDDLEVSAIIDWGYFQGGSAVLDFATIRMFHSEVDTRWIVAGYGDTALFDAAFRRSLLIHAVHSSIGSLAHVMREGNTDVAAIAVPVIRDMLAEAKSAKRRTGTATV
jgi:aminoglycoside phosphotransferase (APT) family kinase protein